MHQTGTQSPLHLFLYPQLHTQVPFQDLSFYYIRIERTRNIRIFPDVTEELGHEGKAEAADLAIGLSLGVKVGATLSTSHVQARQGILECLLEAEEFQDREVD